VTSAAPPSEPANAAGREGTRARAWVRRAATSAVALLAIAFVVWMVPLRDRCTPEGCQDGLLSTLRRANVPLLIALFGVYLGGTLAWAARWRALLGVADVTLTLREAWRITLEAQAGGVLLPGGVAGDALRVAYVRQRAPEAPMAKILASIFTDRAVGLVTLATLALTAALLSGATNLGPLLPLLAAVPVGAVAAWSVLRHPALARSRLLSAPGIRQRVVVPLLEYAADGRGPSALGRGLLFSLLVSGVQLLVVRGLVAALGATPRPEAWVYVGSTFGMIVSALPVAPGAWGTADAAYVFFLGQAAIAPSVAAAVCLLFRVFWYASGLVGAVSALARR
jgi:uncharacterized membrane protein YbhN (UPF0104 family)